MPGLKDLIDKYKKIAKEMPEQRKRLALIYAREAHAITANRIQNTGINAEGQKMPLYSERPFNLGKLNPDTFNAPSKIIKFKKDASLKKNDGSYKALRKAYGLPVDKRTLTFDGGMFKSIIQEVTEHNELKTVVEIKANNEEEQEKINSNSNRVKSNILSFGKDEKELIRSLNEERVKNLLKR